MRAIRPNPAKLRGMVRVRRLLCVPTLILLAGTAQCGSTSDAPPGQALLFIDTDAPSASLTTALGQGFLAEASVDTLRIDVLAPDNSVVSSVDVAAPDEANWPVSFGMQGQTGASVSRLRLRAFRAQRSAIATDEETGAKVFEPIAGYTIDRVVEIPVPNEKGVFGFRVVLRSECRGQRPDFTERTTCVAAKEWNASFRDAIESVPVDSPPPREPPWWPSDIRRVPAEGESRPADCANFDCPNDSVCIPGGFFMLGNLRVVGFGAQKDAVPAHPVAMQPFCIDRTEFTIARFEAAGQPWPPPIPAALDPYGKELCTWVDYRSGPPANPTYPGNVPINCFTHEQAAEACRQAGGRLPTEAEWEYVATGLGRGSLFPWGDEPPTCDTAVLEQQETQFQFFPKCTHKGIEPVDDRSHAKKDIVAVWYHSDGSAGDEVWHMGGSMSEWTLDSFVRYAETTNSRNCWQREGLFRHPSCALVGDTYSVRGGNYLDALEVAYAALRASESDSALSKFIGFRCVYPAGAIDPVEYLEPPTDDELDAGGPETPPRGDR